MSEKPPITTVAGQVLSDEDQNPEARRLAGAVLNQAREDQEDAVASQPETSDAGSGEGAVEAASGEGAGGTEPVRPPEDESPTVAEELDQVALSARRSAQETERTNLQRKHTKMLDEPGYARTLLAVQDRLAEIDKELDE